MWQVSDGQKQILHLHVCGVATEDDVSSGGSHIFLIDAAILVVNPVHRLLDLKKKKKISWQESILVSNYLTTE